VEVFVFGDQQRLESIAALLVLVGAPRLRSLGVAVPAGDQPMSPEHRKP
jgi:hypothetical protein